MRDHWNKHLVLYVLHEIKWHSYHYLYNLVHRNNTLSIKSILLNIFIFNIDNIIINKYFSNYAWTTTVDETVKQS